MKGKVYLIGAGPGDYGLLTLKGLECIKKADVIVYDRLANNRYLEEAKDNCKFIYVGKQSSNHTKTQDEINEIIIEEALQGKMVVRLKGGDPYVFGRGGEEGEDLLEKGVEFAVVPGITSAIGGLCYAGIPITHRDYASSFHVITGHLKDSSEELNWPALAQLKGTLVFLMGMANLENICTNLIKAGKAKDTPVAIINWATTPQQKVVTGTLENIYDVVLQAGIEPPSLIVVGEVVKLRNKLNFFENKALFGKNIVVTRARAQSSKLIAKLNTLGANAIEFPSIKIEEIIPNYQLEEAIKRLEDYTYIVFTSVNGVSIFFNKLYELGFDVRKIGRAKIAAIGQGTAGYLKKYGIKADLVPQKFVAESLVEAFQEVLSNDDKVLIPRASEAREYLVEELSQICSVTEIKIYNTVKGEANKDQILEFLNENKIDYITFTSSSTVRKFIEILGKENLSKLGKAKLISIGPITSETIKSLGLNVYKEAREYTINGVIDTLIKDVREVSIDENN